MTGKFRTRLCDRIRRARELRGGRKSIYDAAEQLEVSVETIEKWENGRSRPPERIMKPLSLFLYVSEEWLRTGKNEYPDVVGDMERTGASHISYNNTARLMAGGYGNLRPPTLLQQRRKYEKLLNESKKYQDEIRARELRLEAYGWIRDAEEQGREPVPLLIEDSAWSLRTRLELRSRVHDDIRMQIARRVVRRKHQEKLIQV